MDALIHDPHFWEIIMLIGLYILWVFSWRRPRL